MKAESVRDIILSVPEEKSLEEMMEADEVKEQTPKEKDSELMTNELSCLLGECEKLKKKVTDSFGMVENVENALHHFVKFTTVFRNIYHEKLKKTRQVKIT